MAIRSLPLVPQPHAGLPIHARAWLDDALEGKPLPSEVAATCDSCVMVPPEGVAYDKSSGYFRPDSKCCTFVPVLANFLVGGLLTDANPALGEGQARVRERIASRVGVTPLGVRPTPGEDALYARVGDESFGRTTTLRCPYFVAEGGGCSVWSYRNGICASWFCKHVRGAISRQFWDSLRDYLLEAERQLAIHCLLEVGFDGVAGVAALSDAIGQSPQQSTAHELDDTMDDREYAELWGEWAGREFELYEATAKVYAGLGMADVRRVGGAKLELRRRLMRERHTEVLTMKVPERLEVRPFQLVASTDGGAKVRVVTYLPCDPVLIPSALLPALVRFDGRPTGEVVSEIAQEHGMVLDETLLVQLVDFQILG